jgi:hypothetical protein
MAISTNKTKGTNKIDSAVFSTIADMTSAPAKNFRDGAAVQVLGYYAAGDGGGGEFRYDSLGAGPDGGLAHPANGGGTWERVWDGATIQVAWYGQKSDYDPRTGTGTDDTLAIQKAIDATLPLVGGRKQRAKVQLKPGATRITQPLVFSYLITDISGVRRNIWDAEVAAFGISSVTGNRQQTFFWEADGSGDIPGARDFSMALIGTRVPSLMGQNSPSASGSSIVADFAAADYAIKIPLIRDFLIEDIEIISKQARQVPATPPLFNIVPNSAGICFYHSASHATISRCSIRGFDTGILIGDPNISPLLIDNQGDFFKVYVSEIKQNNIGVQINQKNSYAAEFHSCAWSNGINIDQRVSRSFTTGNNYDPLVVCVGGNMQFVNPYSLPSLFITATVDSITSGRLTLSSLTKQTGLVDAPVPATVSDIEPEMIMVAPSNQDYSTVHLKRDSQSVAGIVQEVDGSSMIVLRDADQLVSPNLIGTTVYFSRPRACLRGTGVWLKGMHLEMTQGDQGAWRPAFAIIDGFRRDVILEDCEFQLLSLDSSEFNRNSPLVIMHCRRPINFPEKLSLVLRGNYLNTVFTKIQVGTGCQVVMENTVFNDYPYFLSTSGQPLEPEQARGTMRICKSISGGSSPSASGFLAESILAVSRPLRVSQTCGCYISDEIRHLETPPSFGLTDEKIQSIADNEVNEWKFTSGIRGIVDINPVTNVTITSDLAVNPYKVTLNMTAQSRHLFAGKIVSIAGAGPMGADLQTRIVDIIQQGSVYSAFLAHPVETDVVATAITSSGSRVAVTKSGAEISDQYVTLSDSADLLRLSGLTIADFENSQSFTIRIRAYIENPTTDTKYLFFSNSTAADRLAIFLQTSQLRIGRIGSFNFAKSIVTNVADKWMDVAVSFAPGEVVGMLLNGRESTGDRPHFA